MQKISKAKRQIVANLSSRKMRMKHGCFPVEGVKSVSDLVNYSGSLFDIMYLIATPHRMENAQKIVECYSHQYPELTIPEIYEASEGEMKEMSSLSNPPDLIALCRLPERNGEEEILATPLPAGLYLLLDGVQDPGNMGTIIRTAHWMGIKKIFASPDCVDIYNTKVIQSSMASLGSVEVEYVNLPRLVEVNSDIPVAGLLLEGENIYGADLPESCFIVMGNEGNGISEEMRRLLTNAYTIPPFDSGNHAESLNVAIATAITLSEFRRNLLKRSITLEP